MRLRADPHRSQITQPPRALHRSHTNHDPGDHASNGRLGWYGHGEDLPDQLLPKKVEVLTDQRVITVAAGGAHSLAITADEAVWSWGGGGLGKLGHGDTQYQPLPKKVEGFPGHHIVAVSAGVYHSLALTADGAVWSWGGGASGSLGHGEDLSNQLLPKKVEEQGG